jgi:hypothetical protein
VSPRRERVGQRWKFGREGFARDRGSCEDGPEEGPVSRAQTRHAILSGGWCLARGATFFTFLHGYGASDPLAHHNASAWESDAGSPRGRAHRLWKTERDKDRAWTC